MQADLQFLLPWTGVGACSGSTDGTLLVWSIQQAYIHLWPWLALSVPWFYHRLEGPLDSQ